MKAQVVMAVTGLASSAAAGGVRLPLPPMGFNNWARFMTNISESIFVDAAEAMSQNGLLSAGYNRLNLDDAWSLRQRAPNGSMVADPAKFPLGLPWLTDFMRTKGFIPGIYTDAGNLSCGGYPGALDHEERDLKDFVNWGFEYLKMDGCNLPDDTEETYHEIYSRWPKAIFHSHEAKSVAFVFSDSAPAYFSGRKNLTDWYRAMGWAADYGQLARHSADIMTYPKGNAWRSILFNYGQNLRLARFQKPGFFNDPDFLIPDHPSLTMDEKKSQFALWCSMSSPLLLSADIPNLPNDTIDFLTNQALIAVNQDRLAQQATLLSRDNTWDVLTKTLANGDRLLTVLNRCDAPASLNISLPRLGLAPKSSVRVEDLWTGKVTNLPVNPIILRDVVNVTNVPAHGTAVYALRSDAGPITPTGMIFNTNTLNCLTDSPSRRVTFAPCNGTDGQIWAVSPAGVISSLLQPETCIGADDGAVINPNHCKRSVWTYKSSGNLVDNASGSCVTESLDGLATAEGCGYLLNEQVLALPAGVPVAQY